METKTVNAKVARLSPVKRTAYDKALADMQAANERDRIERTPEAKAAAAAAFLAFDAVNPVRPGTFSCRAGRRQHAEANALLRRRR